MQQKRADKYKKLNKAIEERVQADKLAEENAELRQLDQAAFDAPRDRVAAGKARVAGKWWLLILIVAIVSLAAIAVAAAQSMADPPRPTLDPITTPTPSPTPAETPESSEEATETPEPTQTPRVMLPAMAKLYEQNSDLVGWIRIPGTIIDYPVMYTPNDGQFYLYRTFEKQEDPTKQGTVFVDENCSVDPRGTNLLLHGHNMKKGTMFHSLVEYADKEYYDKHPVIEYTTLYEPEQYEIVYAFKSRVYNQDDDVFKYYKFYQANTQEEFDAFVNGCKELALYDTGIEPQFGDEFLTLNTCEYSVENGRMVIVARKITDKNSSAAASTAPAGTGSAATASREPAVVEGADGSLTVTGELRG